jgi:hypothetical protein
MYPNLIEQVVLDVNATPEAQAFVERILTTQGHAAPVRVRRGHRSVHSHLSVIEILIAVPFTAFFASVATEAGKDAYGELKRLLASLRQSPGGDETVLKLIDPGGLRVVLQRDLSEPALDSLAEIEWSEVSQATSVVWDGTRCRWRIET